MYQLVFDRTPFYAEMGGQVGDTGYIESESGERINILNTVKENNLTIHIAELHPSDCSESFSLHVDADRRLKITNNHTTRIFSTRLSVRFSEYMWSRKVPSCALIISVSTSRISPR